MEYFYAGFLSSAKVIGLILTCLGACLLVIWSIAVLAWKGFSENSVLAKLIFIVIILVLVCLLGGLANYFYQNIGWRA